MILHKIQVKSFLRIEYHSQKPVAVSIHMQHLELHLQNKNIPYKKGLLANLKSVYSNESKGSVLKKDIFRSGGQRPPERPKIVLATCVCIIIIYICPVSKFLHYWLYATNEFGQ